MLAIVRAHNPNRQLILVILGLLFSLPVMAQNSQIRAKATAPAAANEQTAAPDVQATPEQNTKQQSEPTVTQPVKRSGSNPARSVGSGSVRSSGSATAKNVAPTPAEPVLPIVPPPPPPTPEVATLASAGTETRSAAEQVAEKTEAIAPVQGLGWAEMAKTIGSIGLIICLILGGYMLFKKFAPQYMTKRPNEREIRLIETLPMGEKRSIVVVQAAAQRFLLACTPGQITLLTALNGSAGTAVAGATDIMESQPPTAFPGNFRNFYEQEKKASAARPSAVKALPPDIRGKMLELRKALES